MTTPTFHLYSQDNALAIFPPLLQPHLPLSNPLYNRLQAPHNIPSRHCLFAASFPPNSTPSEPWTILFADRSRHKESQIWIFNSLITSPTPLSPQQTTVLNAQIRAAVYFLKNTKVLEAPGWPFEPLLKFGCVHSLITTALFAEFPQAIPYITRWNLWHISTHFESKTGTEKAKKTLPPRFNMSRVPESQIDLVIATSSIPRQAATLLSQANVAILNSEGNLAAWVYIGIDGSIATLYVLPEYRGKGFSTIVANEILKRLGEGEFEDLGILGRAWVHADVKVGNVESEAVMRSLGGEIAGGSSYLWVDCEKI